MDKYLTNALTAEERQLLFSLILTEDNKEELGALVDEAFADAVTGQEDAALRELIFLAIRERRPKAALRPMRYRWLAAASVLFILCLGAGYLWIANKSSTASKKLIVNASDLPPGRQGAILTLADGKKIALDTVADGQVTTQGGASVTVANGALVYGDGGRDILYNTMSTPRGRQFRLSLPDGTLVWLNAGSSISYPTVFDGPVRKVRITGEAYFEVAARADMTFQVDVGDKRVVEVIGTHFNINAYDNEKNINTTLLEGAVRVTGDRQVVLKPGEQAQVPAEGEHATMKVIPHANVDKVMAWKNGMFDFEDASFDEIMRQFERWYDIEVVYGKDIPRIQLMGKMTRDVSISGLILFLEKLGIHARLEGRRLIIEER